VSEVLTNAAKHGHASSVTVRVEAGRDLMRAGIRDDGVGGGSGLVGLKDRSGTSMSIELPLRDDAGASPHGS
jgi:signal transduction histidine kinase